MHWTSNSDAIPDCALRNHSEIMREKGGRCDDGAGRDGVQQNHLQVQPLHTSLLLVTFGWLFIAGSLYKAVNQSTSKHVKALFCSNVALCLAAANDSTAGSGSFKM